MAIAGAVLHQLATHTLPLTFFATHYGSLTDDFAQHPNIRNMHMSTLVDDEKKEVRQFTSDLSLLIILNLLKLVFLYKLVDGVAESSFGTHVANLAGVPFEVVERADVISKQFAQQFKEKLKLKQKQNASARVPLHIQADWAYLVKLASGEVKVNDESRGREVLDRLKGVFRSFLEHGKKVEMSG
jgi:DNA mismatch repair protein MSH6